MIPVEPRRSDPGEPCPVKGGAHVWRLISEKEVQHPGGTRRVYQRQRRFYCESCVAIYEQVDPEPIYR